MNDLFATTFAGGFTILFCCIYVVALLVAIATLVLWIWMLIDVITRDDNKFGTTISENSKLVWLLIILLTSWVGAAIYYFVVYKKYPRS